MLLLYRPVDTVRFFVQRETPELVLAEALKRLRQFCPVHRSPPLPAALAPSSPPRHQSSP